MPFQRDKIFMHSIRCPYRKIKNHPQQQISSQKDILSTNKSRCPSIRIYHPHTAADVLSQGFTIHTQQQMSFHKDLPFMHSSSCPYTRIYCSCTAADVVTQGYTI